MRTTKTAVNGSFRSVFKIGSEYEETRKTGECEDVGLITITFVWYRIQIRSDVLRKKQIWNRYV